MFVNIEEIIRITLGVGLAMLILVVSKRYFENWQLNKWGIITKMKYVDN
jgi:hypothetical protein